MNLLMDRAARLAPLLLVTFAAVVVIVPALSRAGEKVQPLVRIPALHAGQKFVYRVRYQAKKVTRAESRIASPLPPEGQNSDVERWVSVEVTKIGGASDAHVAMRTQLLPADGSPVTEANSGVVEFTLQGDGRGSDLQGFDALSSDEQAVWRQWLAQFALGWTFPAKGIKPGEKWNKEEPVMGAALDRLVWEKQYEYVRDEPCPQRGDGGATKSAGECAVVVTNTTMKQHGPHDDATPEDYKVHQLKTSGTALGKIQVVTYISLQSGFVERATEDSAQKLDVLIAKADDSNKAHFNVDATSHAEVVLLH
jgi:hypothetical protein